MKKVVFLFLCCISINIQGMQWLAKRTEEINKRYQNAPPALQQVFREHDKRNLLISDILNVISYTSGGFIAYQSYKKNRRLIRPTIAGLSVAACCCFVSTYCLVKWDQHQIPKLYEKARELEKMARK